MSKLGAPVTDKYKIGVAEVRVGPLTSAGKLTQAHSIGLLDNVTVEVAQESLDLEGGFPKVPVDTAVVKQTSSVTATLREYSRRNLRVMMGLGVEAAAPTGAASTLAADAAADATSIDVQTGDGASFTAGGIVVVFPNDEPEKVSVCLVDSIAVDTLTLNAGTPILHALTAASGVTVFTAEQVAIGNIQATQYFAVQVLQQERSTGRPVGYNFWKAAISSGMTDGSNADDFASTDLSIKLLVPAAAEYGVGGDLNHLASIIPAHPTGMYFGGAD